jgi:hypothetical protein
MPFDANWRNADHASGEVVTSTPSAGRAARPLGRGLEDVSHLLLSRAAETREREPMEDRTPARMDVRPGRRSGVAVLRPGGPITKEELTATIRECQDALETNVRAIDACIPCCPSDEIDILAVDGANQLTIIDVETTLGDGLLLRGVSHIDWVVHNLANVRRRYLEWAIDISQGPRLILIAPGFSPLMRSAVRQIARSTITCFRYHSVKLSTGAGVFFEQVGD